MARFALVNNETGVVLRYGECPIDDVPLQARDGYTPLLLPDDAPTITTNHAFDFTAQAWVQIVSDLDLARQRQQETLGKQCAATIAGGFNSSALGSPHQYGSNDVDQRNIALGGSLMCASDGVWGLVSHTPEQSATVQRDFVLFRDAARVKLAALLASVASANSIPEVVALTWTP